MSLKYLGGCKPKSTVYRFNHSFTKDNETKCWNWIGASRTGACRLYGRIKVNGKSMAAHRYSWELHNNAEIPKGMLVLHKCDNPECVNPDHLFLGTHKENMNDMVRKNRQAKGEAFKNRKPATGSKTANAKLTEDQAREIFVDSRPTKELAKIYGVSQTVIYNIKNLKTWKVANHDKL